MKLMEALETRRSVRKFSDQPVTDEELAVILKCAMLAPSAKNEQPWHFVVVRDAQTRAALGKTSPYTHMAAKAPLDIVICVDSTADLAGDFWVQDCAAATENLLLAARDLNIGSVWCGVYNLPDRMAVIRSALSLPPQIIPFNLICLGHTDQPFRTADRFLPERIHYEKW